MEDSPSRPTVAELTGKFRGQVPLSPSTGGQPSFRRKAPSSLKLQKSVEEESDKHVLSPNRFKVKTKSSPMIEKLQANLALSPTALLPSPKSAELKLPPASPCSPSGLLSPTLRPSQPSSEEEDAVGFDSPPEGAPLPNFNKTRARLSFKRRLPSRKHRRSSGEESEPRSGDASPCQLNSPLENGEQGFDSPEEENKEPVNARAEQEETDCDATEKKPEEMSQGLMEEQPPGEEKQEEEEEVGEEEQEEVGEEEQEEEEQQEEEQEEEEEEEEEEEQQEEEQQHENPTGCKL